jgi:hypothetical protein
MTIPVFDTSIKFDIMCTLGHMVESHRPLTDKMWFLIVFNSGQMVKVPLSTFIQKLEQHIQYKDYKRRLYYLLIQESNIADNVKTPMMGEWAYIINCILNEEPLSLN